MFHLLCAFTEQEVAAQLRAKAANPKKKLKIPAKAYTDEQTQHLYAQAKQKSPATMFKEAYKRSKFEKKRVAEGIMELRVPQKGDLTFYYEALTEHGFLQPAGQYFAPVPLAGGAFSGEIVGIRACSENRIDTCDKRFAYILKRVVSPEQAHEPPTVSIRQAPATWAEDMLFATTPKQEIENLLKINQDANLLDWNREQFLGESKGNYSLYVSLIEDAFHLSPSDEYISVIHGVRGEKLFDYLEDQWKNGHTRGPRNVLKNLGRKLAQFHLRTKRVHLDFSAGNVFYDETRKRFTMIDNHSIAYSPKDLRELALLFAYDRERFIFSQNSWEAKDNPDFISSPQYVEGMLAYEEGYKEIFKNPTYNTESIPYAHSIFDEVLAWKRDTLPQLTAEPQVIPTQSIRGRMAPLYRNPVNLAAQAQMIKRYDPRLLQQAQRAVQPGYEQPRVVYHKLPQQQPDVQRQRVVLRQPIRH